ncbi:MAG: hypothetical protein CM15mP84_04360 [Cellvibrionales bacterium]|nr:MAG: hypothetical protein CM15mP84_04360 [Cellvibrionales bacterium]
MDSESMPAISKAAELTQSWCPVADLRITGRAGITESMSFYQVGHSGTGPWSSPAVTKVDSGKLRSQDSSTFR